MKEKISNMETPFFLIHQDILEQNIYDFESALHEEWPNSRLAYSVKTNSLPWLLKRLHSRNIVAEVVSDEEYDPAEMCGYDGSEIVFNGPVKGEEHFQKAVSQNAIINLDSKKDVLFLSKYARNEMCIGIRVNVPPENFSTEDIGYEKDGFRFGFCEENGDFATVLAAVRKIEKVKLGLHLHCNSITRSVDVYRAIARYASFLIQKYKLSLDYIDMGGGFFGGVPGKTTPKQYISAIREELKDTADSRKTTLIVEPGSAIIGSAVDLYTSVLDVKDTSNARIVTTDGSRIHIDPLWAKSRYLFELSSANNRKISRQIICGYTCMDHDRIMALESENELSVGDQIIYKRVGAYSMTFGGMFIRYYPNVYVKKDNNITCVRKRITTDEYYKIHNCEEN